MNALFWYSIAMLFLALAVGLVLCTIGYRWARHDGYEDGYDNGHADKQLELLAERKQQRHEARHARTSPRQQPPAPPPARDETAGAPVELPGRWYAEHIAKAIETGRKTATITLPEPGEYQPQAGRDSGDGTLTMARVDLPATTGEMAAITDEYIARMAIEEEQHRLALTAGA